MTESSREGNGQRIELSVVPVASRNGPPRVQATGQARYCAFCGAEVGQEGAPERFGEIFCSDAHAEEFVKGVRAVRVQTPVGGGAEVQRADETAPEQSTGAAKPRDWKMALKMAACCGAPLLALVVLAGGGGALFGSAGASGDLFTTLQIERFTPPRRAKPFALPTLEGKTVGGPWGSAEAIQ